MCCGGILGIAETEEDRIGLIHTLATPPERRCLCFFWPTRLPEHPESVPINALVPIEGALMWIFDESS